MNHQSQQIHHTSSGPMRGFKKVGKSIYNNFVAPVDSPPSAHTHGGRESDRAVRPLRTESSQTAQRPIVEVQRRKTAVYDGTIPANMQSITDRFGLPTDPRSSAFPGTDNAQMYDTTRVPEPALRGERADERGYRDERRIERPVVSRHPSQAEVLLLPSANHNVNSGPSESQLLYVKNDQLHQELVEARQTIESLKANAYRLQLAKDKKELLLGPQASDHDIEQKFRDLFQQIKDWTRLFVTDGVRPEKYVALMSEPALGERITRVTPNHLDMETLQQRPRLRTLVRGCIASLLTHFVFEPAEEIWLEEDPAKAFETLTHDLSQSLELTQQRLYHDWRALTSHLLSRSTTSVLSAASRTAIHEGIAKDLMSLVGFFVRKENRTSAGLELQEICAEASSLRQFIRCQRPYWTVVWPSAPIQQQGERSALVIDDVHMQDESNERDVGPHDADKIFVDVVISPCVIKWGNADGDMFDVSTCHVRALVTAKISS